MQERAKIRQIEACLTIHRQIAARVSRGHPADATLADIFRKARHFGARDRRLIAATVFAEFRWRGWVRQIRDHRLRLAAALALDGLVDCARSMAEHAAFESGSPARLQDKAAWIERFFPEASPARIENLLPECTFEEVPDDGLPDFVERYVAAMQSRPPLWLRARRGMIPLVRERLQSAGFACRSDARVPDALRVDGAPASHALRPILHRCAEIQDIASQRVGILCDPRAGEHWWDVCAGSGGKSLHLLELLNGTGHVYCTDTRPHALQELTRRATAAGYHNWSASLLPNTYEPKTLFDGILIDAPCSGIGTWSRNPDARWRCSLRDLTAFRARQIALIRLALPHLKPTGRLIYAVCSLASSETTDVTAAICDTGSVRINRLLRIDPFWGPGIGMWAVQMSAQ